ncbi:MAG: T9SS type A sorting domain-containing protein [Alphaproteobacteria bacterium]|nr:T9SS type A sorting domain-containing protein [Alphaproteobacteria bacterium]
MKNNRFLFLIAFFLSWQPGFTQHHLLDQYDVRQYILDLNISNTSTIISGNVTMNAEVTAASLNTVTVELIDSISAVSYMTVDSVWFNGNPAAFVHSGWLVQVPLTTPVPLGDLFSLQIFYHGNGSGSTQSNTNGLWKFSYKNISHTFNTSQPFYSKVWWPCKELMTDKADSVTFIITTDSTNLTASNGLLEKVEYPGNGKARYHWKTHYPISPYLVSFLVGPLSQLIDYAPMVSGSDSLLLYNLLFSESPYYQMYLTAIDKTKTLLMLNDSLLGEYPFRDEKYGYCLIGMPTIGMEHQTMCMMGYASLDTITTLYPYGGNWFLTAHELAHQWFGDAVICSTWNDAWLVDGFASYMEYVALQHLYGTASAEAWMEEAHTSVLSEPGGSVWIPDSLVSDVRNLFDYRLVYKKGAAILHILRYEINNDSLFFSILKQYISTYRYGSASAANFLTIAESVTGIDLTDFFEQWYYGSGYPVFNLHWNHTGDTLEIRSEQTTSTSITPLFRTTFDIRVYTPQGDTTIRLFQSGSNFTWNLPITGTVDSIAFDPDHWLIQQHTVHTSLGENQQPVQVQIFPNPTTGKVTLIIDPVYTGETIQVQMIDLTGRVVLDQQVMGAVATLDVTGLSPGIYYLRLVNRLDQQVMKIIKE